MFGLMYPHVDVLACLRKGWRRKMRRVSHDLFLSEPSNLLRIKIILLRSCSIYRGCSLNCSRRAFVNDVKCWPNELHHVMINYGQSPSLSACGCAERGENIFRDIVLSLAAASNIRTFFRRSLLIAAFGGGKNACKVFVLANEIVRELSHSNAEPLNPLNNKSRKIHKCLLPSHL
jgi:hypothetical protein